MTNSKVAVGKLIAGRWRVTAELESDKQTSYRVIDSAGIDGELLILPELRDLPAQVKILSDINHENIIQNFEAGSWSGIDYLVRELIAGQNIKDWLWREDRLGYDQALGIACQLCLASTELEKLGIEFIGYDQVNVRVDPQGFVKVDPLGLLKSTAEDPCAAPEERRGRTPGKRSEVFRIGALVYLMLYGKPLRRGERGSVQREILHTTFPNIPPQLDSALDRILAENPDERPGDAAELLDILHPLLMHKPKQWTVEGKEHTPWTEDSRFWLYTALGLFALLILLLIIGNVF